MRGFGTRVALTMLLALPLVAAASDYVRRFEQALADQGFDPGRIDGVFDTALTDALRRYQDSKGLDVTGQLDRATREELMVYVLTTIDEPETVAPETASEPAPAPAPPSPKYGYIETVERQLADAGIDPGAIDGVFDLDLAEALRQFQTQRGLEVNGQLTRQTRAALAGKL